MPGLVLTQAVGGAATPPGAQGQGCAPSLRQKRGAPRTTFPARGGAGGGEAVVQIRFPQYMSHGQNLRRPLCQEGLNCMSELQCRICYVSYQVSFGCLSACLFVCLFVCLFLSLFLLVFSHSIDRISLARLLLAKRKEPQKDTAEAAEDSDEGARELRETHDGGSKAHLPQANCPVELVDWLGLPVCSWSQQFVFTWAL